MVREIFLFRVFKDENTSFAQDFALHHEWNDLFATLQIVRCIRKNKIKLLRTALQIEKSVCLDRVERANTQLAGRLANEIVMHGVDLDRGCAFPQPLGYRHPVAGARGGQDRDAATLVAGWWLDHHAAVGQEPLSARYGAQSW